MSDKTMRGPCDECGKPAARWLGHTAVRVCNDAACWDKQSAKYQAAVKEMSAAEEYAAEMRGWK
jgi:hypothetical protein